MYYVLNANLHRLFLHTGWDNLWNDAWRHQNRLRTSISGEFEKLTLVTNSSDQPAKHPRSNIRLGKEGAEAGEPHWGAQQRGWPKCRWSVLHGHLTSICCLFYIKIFPLEESVSFKSQIYTVPNCPSRALTFFWTCCTLHLVSRHSFWTLMVKLIHIDHHTLA